MCVALLIGWAFVGGGLVWLGLMEPIDSVISVPLLTIMGSVHLIAQGVAYYDAIQLSKNAE